MGKGKLYVLTMTISSGFRNLNTGVRLCHDGTITFCAPKKGTQRAILAIFYPVRKNRLTGYKGA
ncbi:hypothetical protein JCM12296A_11670 [Desulfosarcina cetonica]